jgi:hypothetical protein
VSAPNPARVAPSGSSGSAGSAGGRSTSTLRHLIKQVDKELAALARRHDRLEAELQGAGADHAALARIGAEMAEVAAAVAEAEERWLALSEEAEAARAGG